MSRHLLIFARPPELGQVKTRLAQGIGPAAALAVYEELLALTRAAAAGVAAHKTVWLTAAGPSRAVTENHWPGYEQRVQPAGDLGARMSAAFQAAFAAGATAAVVIGTDCPDLSAELLEKAFQALATHDAVLGPAVDGGYYLLGMKALIPDFFLNKPWSTAAVRAATLTDARRLGLRVAELPQLRDVDTAADLAAWRQGARLA
ncbi:TIGR04282 family arsenosugar biosynthesis glycosyltransferase [uncultured Hymenobacter sp.]|uniref:TIGR04282 family arsenosugar biosynthesis glycosyltransferase n=1 Tax=uncultured Hymenobacter sp. TaxID=170016 RepID=UPI0035CB6CDC